MHKIATLTLLSLLFNCSRPSTGTLVSSADREVRVGADYIAFKVDSVWAYINTVDTATMRLCVPLLNSGVLRGEWLLSRDPRDLQFRRDGLLLPQSEWRHTIRHDSINDIIRPDGQAGILWGCRSTKDSTGTHYTINVLPFPSGGTGNYRFTVTIDSIGQMVHLKYLGLHL
jgi:hypothetical protein